jgi:hypothetical protein
MGKIISFIFIDQNDYVVKTMIIVMLICVIVTYSTY